MFQFTGFRPLERVTEFLLPSSLIRVSVSLCLLAARHGFSQLSAPFFAKIRLGIRLMPFSYFQLHPNVSSLFSCAIFNELRLFWWVWEDLNFRPHAYQACALTG